MSYKYSIMDYFEKEMSKLADVLNCSRHIELHIYIYVPREVDRDL